MEESAPKRRRISPQPSGSAPAEDDAPTNTQETPGSSRRLRPRRPSWASPTKASMSRWNPQILERRRSASPPKSPSPTRSPVRTRPNLGGTAQSPSNRSTTRRQRSTDLPASSPNTEMDAAGRGSADDTFRESTTVGARARTAAATTAQARPNPRPLPPPGPEGEDDFNPFAGRVLRRSPNTGVSIPPPPEPELPPSPNDPVSSTPPRGIHSSSSPSRRRPKNKPKTSSPLKRPPALPGDEEDPGGDTVSTKLFGGKGKGMAPPSRLRQATVLGETTDNVRRLPKRDANAGKRRRRDELRAELEKLQRELDITTRHNERIRAMQAAGRRTLFADEDELMDIVKRHLLSQNPDSPPARSQMLAQAALDPMAIMPFGRPAMSALPSAADEVDLADIRSHHPVSMTAKEELAFLQLFTPFKATSTLTTLPRATKREPLRQLYTIHLQSRHCPGLFSASLDVTIDAMKLNILSLDVTGLEPAAKAELGPFIEKICADDSNRSMQRNVGIAAWSMAEWARVAERRGRFWAQLHRETESKDIMLESSRTTRARRAKRGRDGQAKVAEEATEAVTRRDLLRFMGDQSFDINVPAADGSGAPSSLRLSWKIDFDWSGEAQSRIAVMIGVPGKWHQVDQRSAFGRLPSLFEDLVQSGEDLGVAVRKVIALLVGQE